MSTRRVPTACPPCGKPGTLYGPAVTLRFAPKKPVPLTTGVALNEVAWKDDKGQEVDCTICAYPMSADSGANPWTGPGLFLTQACVNGHVYHKGCLLTHMSRSNNNTATCPECRNPILSEVAASLRRNGAPAPVPPPGPPPLNSGGNSLFGDGPGGGLFSGGGGANQDDFWSGGQEETDAAAARLRERSRLQSEALRAAQLRDPFRARSLEPYDPMTGVNGYFYLVGAANDNPMPLEIMQAMRYRVSDEPELYADKLHIRMYEQNLDPFHNPPHGMKVTLVQYEFNGLSDEEGDTFVGYYLDMVGVPGGLGRFYKEFFDLPTTPMVGVNGAPKWGEDPLGRPPTLQITPDEYDAWARDVREERWTLERELEEHRAEQQEALLQERFGDPAAAARFAEMEERNYEQAAGPRTRARAAREEREQLDDF